MDIQTVKYGYFLIYLAAKPYCRHTSLGKVNA